jgi:hypothetical protein
VEVDLLQLHPGFSSRYRAHNPVTQGFFLFSALPEDTLPLSKLEPSLLFLNMV